MNNPNELTTFEQFLVKNDYLFALLPVLSGSILGACAGSLIAGIIGWKLASIGVFITLILVTMQYLVIEAQCKQFKLNLKKWNDTL